MLALRNLQKSYELSKTESVKVLNDINIELEIQNSYPYLDQADAEKQLC